MKLVRVFVASAAVLLSGIFVIGEYRIPRALVTTVAAETETLDAFTEELLKPFTVRNVGAFRMQARASAIAVPTSQNKEHPYTFYLATWTGGVFKTTNGGVTFKPVFDDQSKITIGAVAVAPSNA